MAKRQSSAVEVEEEPDFTYRPEEGRDPEPGRYVRIVTGVVVEGPLDLPDSPGVFFHPDMDGEWVRIDKRHKVECHYVQQEDGSFRAPPPTEPPAATITEDPLDQILSIIRDNPDVLDRLREASKKS